jgi:hypothetical protein
MRPICREIQTSGRCAVKINGAPQFAGHNIPHPHFASRQLLAVVHVARADQPLPVRREGDVHNRIKIHFELPQRLCATDLPQVHPRIIDPDGKQVRRDGRAGNAAGQLGHILQQLPRCDVVNPKRVADGDHGGSIECEVEVD